MHILNIGILAHVDAGKTSLTERLLFETGVIDRLGSVDQGSTQTDRGEIERRRGITIRTAVASFALGDLRVNLVDTPGHADFVAEVERALGVLDGAVLVLSAVEGVQPHTRVLMKTLRKLRLPTLIFVNKIDRAGARERELLAGIRRRLSPYVVALNTVRDLGTPAVATRSVALAEEAAEVLAERDDGLLELLVDGKVPDGERVRAALARQCADGVTYPWPVTDVVVTLTRTGYDSPVTVAADFRGRTPIVLGRALRLAGTTVYEPCHRFELEVPAEAFNTISAGLATAGGVLHDTVRRADTWVLTGELPAAAVHDFEQRLPGLSHGEGVWWSEPSGDRPTR